MTFSCGLCGLPQSGVSTGLMILHLFNWIPAGGRDCQLGLPSYHAAGIAYGVVSRLGQEEVLILCSIQNPCSAWGQEWENRPKFWFRRMAVVKKRGGPAGASHIWRSSTTFLSIVTSVVGWWHKILGKLWDNGIFTGCLWSWKLT